MAYSIEVLASARMGARVRTCFAVEDVARASELLGVLFGDGSWPAADHGDPQGVAGGSAAACLA